MLQVKLSTSKRKLNIPTYKISENKSRQKSCFIDSNRTDTIKREVSTMTLKYKLKYDCVSRTAVMFSGYLKNAVENTGIRITYQDRVFNPVSLVGVLQAHMMAGDTFQVTIDDVRKIEDVKEVIGKIADEI